MQQDGSASSLPLSISLSTASFLYGTAVNFKNIFYRQGLLKPKRLPCKVISIGNITVGGTGKTPMSIHVAESIRRMGYRVAVISRGYKGSSERKGGIVSDGTSISLGPDQAGDEPFLMASKLTSIPVLVGHDRYAVGQMALNAFGSEVLVLDDGFQHLALARDIDLVLLDDRQPFGNGHLLPRGTLREPISALSRGDAFILTRSVIPESLTVEALKDIPSHRPVFRSFHTPKIEKIVRGDAGEFSGRSKETISYGTELLKDRRVFAFSGIARNDDFKKTIQSLGCNVAEFLEFPDHHRYSDRDIETISRLSVAAGGEFLLTTEKDFVRFAHRRHNWPIDLVVVGIETAFGADADAFYDLLKRRLGVPGTDERGPGI